jgi:16S rRNA processing protein RimM
VRDPDALVPLGVVGRPHGVRGEVRVHVYNPESGLLREIAAVLARPADGASAPRELRILRARRGSKGALVMSLDGVDDVPGAVALRGAELCVRRSELPPVEDGEWYHVDLVGLRVMRPDGAPVGEVIEVVPYPTVDCIAVSNGEGVREVPMREPWLVSVDLAAGAVIVGDLEDVPLRPARRKRP